mmetsp:Transcript_32564/g.67286  ORF Transcript_32564/g.67286 Transcript_32564/m.67286 type:complete len:116 (-) Transcript_32564:980-1327(-)
MYYTTVGKIASLPFRKNKNASQKKNTIPLLPQASCAKRVTKPSGSNASTDSVRKPPDSVVSFSAILFTSSSGAPCSSSSEEEAELSLEQSELKESHLENAGSGRMVNSATLFSRR